MATKLIVANWKMRPESVDDARKIITTVNNKSKNFGDAKLVVCPPFVYLNEVAKIITASKNIILGAQDVFVGQGQSHTGEVGIELLKKAKVKYVLVGHSERREILDNNENVHNPY